MSSWRVIDGCPCPAVIAPYVYVVLRGAGFSAISIYRGEDPQAKAILHAHGKHTQGELRQATPRQRIAWGISGTPNPPGTSMHELRSDGRAKRGPAGRHLQEWEIGIDSGPNTKEAEERLEHEARKHGWSIYHPYTNATVEGHHWGFRVRPYPRNLAQRARLIVIRARLPRR